MILVKNFKLLTVIHINKINIRINRYKYITNNHLATRVVYAALRFLYLEGQSHPFCYGPCRAFEKTVSERERENETDSCLWLVETIRVLFLQVESDSIQTVPNFIPLKSKPVIQPNKNLYTLEYMINFHLIIWRRKHLFYHLNQEGNKLQGYAIYVDILLIQNVNAFIVTLNHKLKTTHLLELEGNWLILQSKGKKSLYWNGQQK